MVAGRQLIAVDIAIGFSVDTSVDTRLSETRRFIYNYEKLHIQTHLAVN